MLLQGCSFISTEPALVSDTAEGMVEQPVPAILVSFGGESGPVQDHLISLQDARELIMQTLASLSHHGDPIAQEIEQTFFKGN
jgi:hypothetical protein